MAGSDSARTGAAGDAGFYRDEVAFGEGIDARSESDDFARGLVAEDERLADDVAADAAVLVVVHIRGTDADRADTDEDLPRTWVGKRDLAGVHMEG